MECLQQVKCQIILPLCCTLFFHFSNSYVSANIRTALNSVAGVWRKQEVILSNVPNNSNS